MRNHLIVGTATSVGKNLLTCALLSSARRRGLAAYPFKPFAIDLGNDCSERDGRIWTPSISYQCLGAGQTPRDHMNPVRVMFETPHATPTLCILGKSVDFPYEYEPLQSSFEEAVTEAISQYPVEGVIIAEGSGCACDGLGWDFVHSFAADALDAAVHIIANAEFGGAYAQLVGTLELMPPQLRNRVQSLVINRLDFPLNLRILDEFVAYIHDRYQVEIVEVIPTIVSALALDEQRHPSTLATMCLTEQIDALADEISTYIPKLLACVFDPD